MLVLGDGGSAEINTLDAQSVVVVDRNTEGRIQTIFDDVNAIVPTWRAARRRYDLAVQHQSRATRAAERHLKSVLAGMGLQRWHNLVSSRAQIYTTRDGLDMIRARRIRPDVEAALARLSDVETSQAEGVAAAGREMGEVAARLVPFGHLAVVVSGCPMAELQRMARNGSESLKNTRSGGATLG